MRLARLAATCLALSAALPSRAERPRVVVDAPDFHPLPVAVAPFLAEGDAHAAAEATEVVRADLARSGLFEVLDPKGFLADPGEGLAPASIKFSRWADVGAEGLVKARVRKGAEGFSADLRLLEVRAGRELLARTLPAADARGLGHRIADEVVRHYTGERGIFRTRIAAIRKTRDGRELVVFDADGQNARVLLSEKALLLMPSWRPDGEELLVTSYRGGGPELWRYRFSDRSFRKVPTGRGAMGGSWSPDGSRIAFTAIEGNDTDVWTCNPDGTGQRRLTTSPALDLSPSWSPDGKRLAFVSDRAGTPQLYVMNADGSEQRRLTFQGSYNQTPQWSPRGDLIAFTARDERRVFDLFAVALDGGRVQRLTQDQGRTNEEPSWAPNGRMVAFTSDRGGLPQLVVSDPRGERQTVLTSGGELMTPAWGPLPAE